ncbi:MAG TPA: enoyl-CoA hydratase-related protein [Mycobacteriales bacterium]|nr:enoyl-CoA hydratase-related protein [Mycobacteriales bacterium]
MPSGSDELRVDVVDGVARLTLNRPKARNALSIGLRDDLVHAVRDCRASDEVRAVLITGAGGAFCAGMDLSASSAANAGKPDFDPRSMSQALREGVHALITDLWELDKPTVAAVDGAAVGPGAHLALACDFVLVDDRAKFIWSFSKIGLVVDAGGAYLLPRLVGLAKAKELVLLGGSLSGDDAVAAGIAYRRCASAEALDQEATALATKLAQGPTRALGMSKRLLNRSLESSLADSLDAEAAAQALATASSDLVEGMAAFREKRDPKFTGH